MKSAISNSKEGDDQRLKKGMTDSIVSSQTKSPSQRGGSILKNRTLH